MKSRESVEKNKFFTSRMFYRFLIPSMMVSIGLSLSNIADALVVGAKMGETGLAAIGLVTPIFMIFNVMDLGIAIGGSVKYSRLLGEGKAQAGVRDFNQMLYASLLISILMALLGCMFLPSIMRLLGTVPSDGALYMAASSYAGILFMSAPLFFLNFLFYFYIRCDDNQKLASIGLFIGNSVDIILNIVFVILLHMGVEGAAFATVIGKAAAICIYLPHLLRKHRILRFELTRPDLKLILNNFRNGFSSSSRYLFQFILFIIMNNMLMQIGGEDGLAIFDVTVNFSYILFAVYEGIGSSIQPLIGTFYGEKNRKAIRITLSLALRWSFLLGTAAALTVVFMAVPICSLFGLSTDNLVLGSIAVRLLCISTVFGGFSVVMGCYYQAIGKEKLVLLINFLRTFALYLIFAFLFAALGIRSVWWMFPATELASFIVWGLWKGSMDRTSPMSWEMLKVERILSQTIEKKEDFSLLTTEVESFCDRWSASPTQQYYVNLMVEEICQAIILYGFTELENGYIELTLIANEDSTFELHIRDNAIKYNPFDMKTKRLENDSDEGMEGIGILMVKSKAREFFYRRYQGFNTLTVKV